MITREELGELLSEQIKCLAEMNTKGNINPEQKNQTVKTIVESAEAMIRLQLL